MSDTPIFDEVCRWAAARNLRLPGTPEWPHQDLASSSWSRGDTLIIESTVDLHGDTPRKITATNTTRRKRRPTKAVATRLDTPKELDS